ncbi:hypothetical protein SEA_MUSETTA_19 [Microbacterium phage Musetta]|nr:hypothetical protein SEA_MUSETTA_19 [Microbacterium phage Musetta]QYC54141.1 hypothetical protein SEA_WELCOME_19 [Microbacterium phage Welcome]UVK62437.1 hypothetical protein SEA_YUMA_19 [Microbacterium phage Yuma]WMI33893.1 hypothetical protein SEA_ERENYEAGER_18 [Microbacterium phage Erenyeager]
MTEREPAITEMIDLVQQADEKMRQISMDTKKPKRQRSKMRRHGLRRALRRALKR